MELEKFISGYCRQLDASRMVEVLVRGGRVIEADCCYGSCPYESNCPLAQQIGELEEASE